MVSQCRPSVSSHSDGSALCHILHSSSFWKVIPVTFWRYLRFAMGGSCSCCKLLICAGKEALPTACFGVRNAWCCPLFLVSSLPGCADVQFRRASCWLVQELLCCCAGQLLEVVLLVPWFYSGQSQVKCLSWQESMEAFFLN